MSLPAYMEYKDSGVEWLGDVPQHWQVTILKYNCSFSGGGTPSKEKPEYWGGDIPWVSPKDMKVFKLVDTEDKITKDALLESSTNMVKTGALLMVVRSSILQRKIPIAINFVDVTLNQDMKALRFKESIFAEYFSYLVMGHESKFLLLWLKQGATVESIEHEYLANSVIPWPSIKEQTTIARFLDHETAKIDALIAEQQRLIELLKEKRQAVISHAVTKGLDPNAPMKDSGVEWLGDVPEHWRMTILKYNCSFSGGGTPSKEKPEYWSGNIPWVSPKDMKVSKLVDTEDKITKEAVLESSTNIIKPYALLMVVRSGILQRTIPIAINLVEVTLNQDMKALRFKESIFAEYFSYLTMGYEPKFLLLWLKQGATVESIEHEYLANTLIPWPDLQEQTAIVEFLDQQTAKIDELISHAHQGIDLLKERRSALISAAVTGKIDVRGWQPPATAATTPQGQQQILFDD